MHISFNAAITALKSRFTEHLVVEIISLSLAEFLCELGVQCILGSFLFVTVTSELHIFFRNYVLSDTVLSTGLPDFVCVDVMLLTLFRASSLIKT